MLSQWLLLANHTDYLGLGKLEGEEGAQVWRMTDGRELPMEAVTSWGSLFNVQTQLGPVEEKQLFNADGYPSNYAHLLLQQWTWTDPMGWFELARKLWDFKKHFFSIAKEKDRWVVSFSTAGTAENEALVHSMQMNQHLWEMYWVSSRVGGHYVMHVNDEDERGPPVDEPPEAHELQPSND